MGCCFSDAIPEVPDNQIPDPEGVCKFVTHHAGMRRDYEVYKGAVDPGNRWLFLNHEGGVGTKIDLENYVRNEEKEKGEVLCSCEFEPAHYQQEFESDSDSEQDEDTWGAFDDFFERRHKYAMKWKMTQKAHIKPGTKGEVPYILKCKAKGVATRHVQISHNEEGEVDKTKHDDQQVTKVSIKVLDAFEVQLDKFTTYKASRSSSSLMVDTKAFIATKEKGWKETNTTIETKEGSEPSMALLMAHVCLSGDFNPNTISYQFVPSWHSIQYCHYTSDYDSDDF